MPSLGKDRVSARRVPTEGYRITWLKKLFKALQVKSRALFLEKSSAHYSMPCFKGKKIKTQNEDSVEFDATDINNSSLSQE